MAPSSRKLVELERKASGLLQRLHYLFVRYAPESKRRPAFLADQQFKKPLQTLVAKFPELPDKIVEGEGLMSRAKPISEELQPAYETFVDALDWKNWAFTALTETIQLGLNLNHERLPVLTEIWWNLYTAYCQLHLLISQIVERKTIIALFYKVVGSNEPNYSNLSKWIQNASNPFAFLTQEFSPFAAWFAQQLNGFVMPYIAARTVQALRAEGAVSITLKPELLTKPIQDQKRWEVLNAPNMFLWISYAFTFTPEVLANDQNLMTLFKFVASETYILPVYRSVGVYWHKELEGLWANYKKANLSKVAKVLKETLAASVNEGAVAHRNARVYFRQELSSLVRLLSSSPGLLAPKIQVLFACIARLLDELHWLLFVNKYQPPKDVKKTRPEDFQDRRLVEIIHVLDQALRLIRKHERLVQLYYIEYLTGADAEALKKIDASTIGEAGVVVKPIIDALASVNPNSAVDLSVLRNAWEHGEFKLGAPNGAAILMRQADSLRKLQLVYVHSKNVDLIGAMCKQFCDVSDVWYFRGTVIGAFKAAIEDQTCDVVDGYLQPYCLNAFFSLLEQFTSNASPYNPDELGLIASECVHIAKTFLEDVSTRVVNLMKEIARNNIAFDDQLEYVHAAYPLFSKNPQWKPPKDFVPPTQPGTESSLKNRAPLEQLRQQAKNLGLLCSAFQEFDRLRIHDHEFSPREYLREKLLENCRSFVSTNVRGAAVAGAAAEAVAMIERPRVMEARFRSFLAAAVIVESYVGVDVGGILHEVYLAEFSIPGMAPSGKYDWSPEKVDLSKNAIGAIVAWYEDFITKRVPLSAGAIVWSPNRRGFVSKVAAPFKAELYADAQELISLARLIGPYGVKLIERQMLQIVVQNVSDMKNILLSNSVPLEEIRAHFNDENRTGEALKRLKDVDAFMQRAVTAGLALEFRRLLRSCLGEVIQSRIPFVANAIAACFGQYTFNLFMAPDFLPLDTLAADAGLELSLADQFLKHALRKQNNEGDRKAWALLPAMFAASTSISQLWRDAVYRPIVEAHENNAHVLAYAINQLLISLRALATKDLLEVRAPLAEFVEIMSAFLLRLADAKNDKRSPNTAGVFVFMDLFFTECPLLTRDAFEASVPYPIVRNMWASIYRTVSLKKGAEEEVF